MHGWLGAHKLCIFAFAIYDVMGLGFVMFRAGVFLGWCVYVCWVVGWDAEFDDWGFEVLIGGGLSSWGSWFLGF